MEKFGKKSNKDSQTELVFESAEDTLNRVLLEINNSNPLIREVIKDRITYDGKNFIINDKKMTEVGLKESMARLNKYKMDQASKEYEADKEDRIKDTPGWDLYGRYKGY